MSGSHLTISALNDRFRQDLSLGTAAITRGVAALGEDVVQDILRAVASYDDFSPRNDPYGEHDFGALEIAGERIFWKIDYYDKTLNAHSRDAADPSVTERVITIMLAREY
jgi:hypothetical protein